MRRTARLTGALRGRTAAVTIAGAALALAGTGTAAAAALAPAAPAHAASAAPAHAASAAPAYAHSAPGGPAHSAPAGPAHSAPAAPAHTAPAHTAPAHAVPARTAPAHTAPAHSVPAHSVPAHTARVHPAPTPARRAAATPAVAPAHATPAAAPQAAPTWGQIERMVARQTSPSEPRAANWLKPVGTSGPQAWMPISGEQMANATTIVQRALARGMGIRSAVIAVATSMQEAQLQNINYGDSDSLGLFQQRPSAGWGTPQQILNPQYAADAFLTALQQHQASDPGWATQPLWANAQAVQNSGFPFAYAKWENQAASMVRQIVTQVR